MSEKTISSALISVFDKHGLEPIVKQLNALGIKLYSTGGTRQFIEKMGVPVVPVESLTDYPSILGGRVKTLHPKVFGGILSRRDNDSDKQDVLQYDIPAIDLVIVDLYPFEETVQSGASEAEVIEKIDIGGIALIRAAAKNFNDVLIVSHKGQYAELLKVLNKGNGKIDLETRRQFAVEAFKISSHYDTQIYRYFNTNPFDAFKESILTGRNLRYGENPHQKARFFGDFEAMFDQLHGKEISYNNILDIDAAVHLIGDFSEPCVAILKHNNACGLAVRNDLVQAWKDALAGDPVSAFGGIIIVNRPVEEDLAKEINTIFCEVVIAPQYSETALTILKSKKNRILLVQKTTVEASRIIKTALNGVLYQERDTIVETAEQLKTATKRTPTSQEVEDLLFANILVKHTKSNAIVLAKGKQLLASGTGQTSRVDALKQAIEKARHFGFDLQGAVMASDAFFPFKDSVEIAHEAGITAVIQPGGSIRDQETIDFCDATEMAMVFTGIRHFKH